MEILAVIPARGGSKGIPRKNVRLIAGKPLIYYAIHNAQQCGLITDVAVSSDDEKKFLPLPKIIMQLRSAVLLLLHRMLSRWIRLSLTLWSRWKKGKISGMILSLHCRQPLLCCEVIR